MGSRSSLAPTRSLFNVVTRPDMKMLPSYTPEVLPGYELTPTEIILSSSPPTSSLSPSISSYYYRSERMDLDLGPRKWGTRLPSYGKGGVVKGTVTIRSFKHVDKVVVSVSVPNDFSSDVKFTFLLMWYSF
ncbi:hypothetical protein RSOLAG1IB_09885 [Rhizoctonia solani AG-1 IB]|uniref:Uncharacterized protein n=1 Tax=Thanatephorus cucumeris (strain AG1-IB / isolate 7/3/14) TaxID=1108050 RepID=A0A0B7FYE8_THACB|nr:hypothetical protein RSOLAG1IB_09885 [Rhizoctonia solani AG-1 IB]